MKKGIAVLAIVLLALMTVLVGCSKKTSVPKEIQVVLKVNGETADVVTVDSFNNALVEEPVSADGEIFKGWTLQESWEDPDSVPVLPNRGLVRYDDVKGAVVGDARSVILNAVFGEPPRRDLVVAWYSKESTSGMNQGHMDVFKEKLYAFLKTQGYEPEKMDIVIRDYNGGVADTCAAISKDADVDITVGWSSTGNLTSTGGWTEGEDFLENTGSITIGAKARYSARLSDTDMSKLVYAWILKEFGPEASAATTESTETAASAPAATETAPAVTETTVSAGTNDGKLVVAWYAKEGTSGLNQGYMDAFQAKLVEFLASKGYSADILEVRGYDGKVGETCAAITASGDVDLMVGWAASSNLVSTGGWTEGKDFLENTGDITIGEKARYAARISDDDMTKLVYAWIIGEYGPVVEAAAEEPAVEAPAVEAAPAVEEPVASEPVVETVKDGKLVVAWYAKESTSGLNQDYMDAFKAKLVEFMASAGYTTDSVEVRGYDGKVGETCAAITASGDVDLMVGWSSTDNLTTTGGWTEGKDFLENTGDITIGAKARYAARITDTDLSKLVYAWILSEYGPVVEEPAAEEPAVEAAPEAPAAEPAATETPEVAYTGDGKLVIGWYAKSATSGMTEDMAARLLEAVKALIGASDYKACVNEVIVRPYDGVVAEVQSAVTADGDVDLMVAMKKFELEGIEMEVQQDVPIGEKTDRRIHRISNDEAAVYVFEWLKTDEARSLFVAK